LKRATRYAARYPRLTPGATFFCARRALQTLTSHDDVKTGCGEGRAPGAWLTSQMPALIAYIRDQEEHHRKRSFADELAALLQRHGVAFDSAYLCG